MAFLHTNHLGYDLVGLDDVYDAAFSTDAQPLAFADVTERGPLHGCALQFHWVKDSNRRDCRCGARPFNVIKRSLGTLILPLKSKAGARGMMACDGASLCV